MMAWHRSWAKAAWRGFMILDTVSDLAIPVHEEVECA